MDEIVSIRCLTHVYPDRTEVRLCGLDFVVRKSERVVVLGPNGSGKTTLLMHITGLLKPVEGEVTVLGVNPARDFARIRSRIGVVLQDVDEQIIGPTVWDDVAFGPRNQGVPVSEVRGMVDSITDAVGIGHLSKKVPHYLSGGEKKKVALAGAMVLKPDILVLDEPFDGLDSRSRRDILALLHSFNSRLGTTVIMTTHDVDSVPLLADTIYVIAGGRIAARGTPREIFSRPDVLTEANLQLPVLVDLFGRLQAAGVDIGVPLTVGEAKDALLKAIAGGQVPHGE